MRFLSLQKKSKWIGWRFVDWGDELFKNSSINYISNKIFVWLVFRLFCCVYALDNDVRLWVSGFLLFKWFLRTTWSAGFVSCGLAFFRGQKKGRNARPLISQYGWCFDRWLCSRAASILFLQIHACLHRRIRGRCRIACSPQMAPNSWIPRHWYSIDLREAGAQWQCRPLYL